MHKIKEFNPPKEGAAYMYLSFYTGSEYNQTGKDLGIIMEN
jgi:hypothetical protein